MCINQCYDKVCISLNIFFFNYFYLFFLSVFIWSDSRLNFFRRLDLGLDPSIIKPDLQPNVFDASDDCYSIHLFRKILSGVGNFHMFSSIQHVIRHIHQLYARTVCLGIVRLGV